MFSFTLVPASCALPSVPDPSSATFTQAASAEVTAASAGHLTTAGRTALHQQPAGHIFSHHSTTTAAAAGC